MKNSKFVIFFAISIFFLLLNFGVSNSSQAQDNTVSGFVSVPNTELNLSGCLVEIYEAGTSNLVGSTYTDGSGYYSIGGIGGYVDVIAFPNDIIEEDYISTGYGTSINVTTNMTGINIQFQHN